MSGYETVSVRKQTHEWQRGRSERASTDRRGNTASGGYPRNLGDQRMGRSVKRHLGAAGLALLIGVTIGAHIAHGERINENASLRERTEEAERKSEQYRNTLRLTRAELARAVDGRRALVNDCFPEKPKVRKAKR